MLCKQRLLLDAINGFNSTSIYYIRSCCKCLSRENMSWTCFCSSPRLSHMEATILDTSPKVALGFWPLMAACVSLKKSAYADTGFCGWFGSFFFLPFFAPAGLRPDAGTTGCSGRESTRTLFRPHTGHRSDHAHANTCNNQLIICVLNPRVVLNL